MKKTYLYTAIAMIFCIGLALTFLSTSSRAGEWDRKTVVNFSAPVEVPGVGAHNLPAGTYVFKIFDSLSDRHIVQIFSEDEKTVLTTILAIPNYRLKTTDKTVMTFRERAEGQPEAIRAWFYPGRQWGEEFVYPKSRAIELAKITNQPILATPIELDTAPIEALKTAPVIAVAPTGEVVEVAKVVETPPVEVAAVPTKSMPQTASSLPLAGLIGLLSLGAGLALVVISRRAA
ncbi:MAG: hypothetical protein LAO31_17425 [Acidobacteriia bacterium]|nr:hypothetical protein [Terriglobia bacterium]